MKRDFIVRSFQLGDEEEIVSLLQSAFEGWPHRDIDHMPMDYWRWKYLDNPFKTNIIALGVSENRIIGANHSIPLRVKIGRNFHLSSYAADTVVHPNFRGRGISKQMIEHGIDVRKRKNVKFTYFVTRNPILIKFNLKYYPLFPHPIKNLVKIYDVEVHLRSIPLKNTLLMNLGFRGSKLINFLRYALSHGKRNKMDVRVSASDSFDDRIDVF